LNLNKEEEVTRNKILIMGLIVVLLITLASLSGCVLPEGGEEEGSSIVPMIIFLVVIFAMFYFLMIRPQRKRQKQHEEMMMELKRGDRIITAGGVYGTVESVNEENVVIKVESGATMRVARGSVAVKREK
jgi:preprotein translocase subunit YajC